ncbi:hypothetical protein GGR56DRAFT_643458 [Xylariaceae sp. FL0804]|nr:hypothetical protein GGR56DRAFT_643458 [Xylariaceae sp. FL0804]
MFIKFLASGEPGSISLQVSLGVLPSLVSLPLFPSWSVWYYFFSMSLVLFPSASTLPLHNFLNSVIDFGTVALHPAWDFLVQLSEQVSDRHRSQLPPNGLSRDFPLKVCLRCRATPSPTSKIYADCHLPINLPYIIRYPSMNDVPSTTICFQ